MAYGGGASPTGALGQIAEVVSPPVALGVGEVFHDIADVASNGTHTLIVRRDGSIWSLGGPAPPHQIAGLVDLNRVAIGGNSRFAIDSGGVLWVWTDTEPTPIVSAAISDVTALDANTQIAVAARWDGSLWTWDHLAGSTPVRLIIPTGFIAIDVAVGDSIAAARSFDGEVIAWNPSAPESVELIATGAKAIAAGGGHVVLARADGSVQTLGANDHGQLGNGSLTSSSTLVSVPGLTNVTDVAAGAAHSVAVTSNGMVFSWGSNTHRQLLVPTATTDVTTPIGVMDVPRTARYAFAKDDATILLNDPVALATAHNLPYYPAVFECGRPFDAQFSLTGFDTSDGVPNSVAPGITNLVVTFDVPGGFERSGPVGATVGNLAVNGTRITWSLPSLGATTATLSLRLYAAGPEGEYPVFEPLTYISDEQPSPVPLRTPLSYHRECTATPDVQAPIISVVTPSRNVIAPPNRQMVPVAILVDATDNVSTPVCSITGVTSNEAINGDWAITGPLNVNLRAERNAQGNGRVYRIAVSCVDEAGNTATGSTTVLVSKGNPHQ
jgi:hypothetical protein